MEMDLSFEYLDISCFQSFQVSNRSEIISTNISRFCAYELGHFPFEEHDNYGLEPAFKWILLFLYVILFIYSIFGNGLICWAFKRGIIQKTKTNYFILTLSVTDIVYILCELFLIISNTVLNSWPFWLELCPVVFYSLYLTINFRAFILVALTASKYIAILQPMSEIRRTRNNGSKLMMFIAMLASVTISLPAAMYARVSDVDAESGQHGICIEAWDDLTARYIYGILEIVMQYCLPILVMGFSYTHIIVILRRRHIPGEPDQTRDARVLQQKRKVHIWSFLHQYLISKVV